MRAEIIKYPMGALTAEGALIYDENVSGKRPALLMAPNWMGMTDGAIKRGRLIAASRYVVFVADMYGAGTRPANFAEAADLAIPLRADPIEQRNRIRAAFEAIIAEGEKRALIDERRAAVGFCFGGGNVLELAREGADIAAAVSIHGDLKTALQARKGAVKAAPPGGSRRAGPGRPNLKRKWMQPARNGKWSCSRGFCMPLPTRGQTYRGSPPGTNRRRGKPTPSCTNFWQIRLPHGSEPSPKMSFFQIACFESHGFGSHAGAKFP
jgi:hypothetical protein